MWVSWYVFGDGVRPVLCTGTVEKTVRAAGGSCHGPGEGEGSGALYKLIVSTAGFFIISFFLAFSLFLGHGCWVLCNAGLRIRYAERQRHGACYLALTRHSSAPFPASSPDKCQKRASKVISPSILGLASALCNQRN